MPRSASRRRSERGRRGIVSSTLPADRCGDRGLGLALESDRAAALLARAVGRIGRAARGRRTARRRRGRIRTLVRCHPHASQARDPGLDTSNAEALRLPSAHGGARRRHPRRPAARGTPMCERRSRRPTSRPRGRYRGRCATRAEMQAVRVPVGRGSVTVNQRVAFPSSESARRRPRPAVRRRRWACGRETRCTSFQRTTIRRSWRCCGYYGSPVVVLAACRDRAWPVAEQCPIRPARRTSRRPRAVRSPSRSAARASSPSVMATASRCTRRACVR